MKLTALSLLLEIGIFGSQILWLYRTRHIRRLAKKAGKTYDEYVAEEVNCVDPGWSGTGEEAPVANRRANISPTPAHESPERLETCKTRESNGPIDSPRFEAVDLEKGTMHYLYTQRLAARPANRD
jgi:hypothetical protein